MTTSLRRILLLAAAVLPLSAGFATAQYRIDTSAANDANNRIGSGGFNDSRADGVTGRLGGLAGNYIVTGNVTGGRAFRGQLGYTDASSFRGNLGSSDIDRFTRDSAGVGQLRGAYNSNAQNTQPFFGNRTVAPPPGFVRSPVDAGTFVQKQTQQVDPNDGRIDFGGANRGAVTQALLTNRQQYGNAGLAPTTGLQWNGLNSVDPDSPLQLSEYTSLARQRRDLFGTNDQTSRLGAAVDPSRDASGNGLDQSGNSPLQNDPRLPTGGATAALQPAVGDVDTRGGIGDTGQSLSRRTGTAADNNTQYAKLRDRLAQVRGEQANRDKQTNDNRVTGSGPIDQQSGGVSTGQGRQPGTIQRAAGDEKTTTDQPGATPGATPAAAPGDKSSTPGSASPDATPAKTPSMTGGTMSPAATDTLKLPRPDDQAAPKKPAAPIEIQSLATGVKDAKLAKALTDAEVMMKAGKFGSAIDQYERAEELASDDPLVFMGRSIAELGGGYYRNAEVHLRSAFKADESLLYAKFDLRNMIGDDRLNTLAGNLSDIAGKNASDPGPLLLLAFIYYNGGMEDRAARALDMAQVRAGGKDRDIDALRKNWSLSAPTPDTKSPETK